MKKSLLTVSKPISGEKRHVQIQGLIEGSHLELWHWNPETYDDGTLSIGIETKGNECIVLTNEARRLLAKELLRGLEKK